MTGELDIIGIFILGGVWCTTLAVTSVSRRRGIRRGGILLDAAQLLFYILFYPATRYADAHTTFHLMMLAVAAVLFINVLYNCRYPFWDRVFAGLLVWGSGQFLGTVSWYIYHRAFRDLNGAASAAAGAPQTQAGPMAAATAVFLILFLIILASDHYLLSEETFAMSPRRVGVFAALVAAAYFLSAEGDLWMDLIVETTDEDARFLVRTIMDVCTVLILYMYVFAIKSANARTETLMMENILQSQYRSYQASRDSMDMVNQKYHDLKHQILLLKEEAGSDRAGNWLEQMEEEIRSYETGVDTGDPVLDVVLRSKLSRCRAEQIELKCMADGQILCFMNDMDISALFGNILDNAMECEQQIAQQDRRLIRLTVQREKQFLSIFEENYCPETPGFAGGLPVTMKEDTYRHGYGVKSIVSIVKKYEGSVSFGMEENWFQLRILIPMKENDAQQ